MIYIIIWLFCGVIGGMIGNVKKIGTYNRNGIIVGSLLGFFLGLIGLFIIACFPNKSIND